MAVKMKGIEPNKFKDGIEITYNDKSENFYAKTLGYWKTHSEHGRSMATVICGFCTEEVEVFIKSFFGCGKKCTNCGALIGVKNTRVELERMYAWQIRDFFRVVYQKGVTGDIKKQGVINIIKVVAKRIKVSIVK